MFLFSEEDIRRAATYVQDNPLKEGKKKQNWNFVRSVDEYFSHGHEEPVPAGRR